MRPDSLRRQPSLRRTSSSLLPIKQVLPAPADPPSPKKIRRRSFSARLPHRPFLLLLLALLLLTVAIGKSQLAFLSRASPSPQPDPAAGAQPPLLSAPLDSPLHLHIPSRTDVVPSLPRSNPLSGLAPRRTHHALHGSRLPPNATAVRPELRAVLFCRAGAPCCTTEIPLTVAALRNQTLVPSHLTVIHACRSDSERTALRRAVRGSLDLAARPASSYALLPAVADHACGEEGLASCVLAYLALGGGGMSVTDGHVLLMDSGVVLEPAAVEKMWMKVELRDGVKAVRPEAYVAESLKVAEEGANALLVRKVEPKREEPVMPVPVLYKVTAYREAIARVWRGESDESVVDGDGDVIGEMWGPFTEVLGKGRVLREALYTSAGAVREGERYKQEDVFRLGGTAKRWEGLPAHLFSELAFQRWSAQRDEDEMYADTLFEGKMNVSRMAFPEIEQNPQRLRLFLLLPWMEMGGSEKCMLDIAKRALAMQWSVTFVLTMPFWHVDKLGERGLQHQWLDKALVLSSDTFDLLSLSSHEHSVRAFRHLLESRQPDFLLMANTRWGYANSRLVKAVSPRTIVADYNHMIHMNWEKGGMPRYGANNSAYLDLHLTASHNVADSMRRWIRPDVIDEEPDKVRTCYIGTDPKLLYEGDAKTEVRARMRNSMKISESDLVVLFAGRFVVDKGLDVVAQVISKISAQAELAERLVFLFVGSGADESRLTSLTPTPPSATLPRVIIHPPARGLRALRDYYATSDILLLPSVNEGIALVAYEAMAAGMLVMTTDVGGQKELITPQTGILLPNYMSISRMANYTLEKLTGVAENAEVFGRVAHAGQQLVRTQYTTEKFTSCVLDNLMRVREGQEVREIKGSAAGELPKDLQRHLVDGATIERYHGEYNLNAVHQAVQDLVTIGVKTYVCDASVVTQVGGLVRSIRVHYPNVRILLGNDGPIRLQSQSYVNNDSLVEEILLPHDSGISFGRNYMVNSTTTRYFVLVDDDHVFDDTTNLITLVNGIQQDDFDLVGMRIRNLPGIDELERIGLSIPRYVALIRKLENKDLTLCVWNENEGPSVYGITHPIPVDVLHNAFIGKTEVLRLHPWRNELIVNEHMTFFLDAKNAGVRVGYLPSVFVHHHPRDYSDCYYKVRFQEDKFQHLLPYKEQFLWDMKCNSKFPQMVRDHILKYELDL